MEDKILDAPQNGLSKKLFALHKLPRIADTERLRSKTKDKNKRKTISSFDVRRYM